MAARIIINRFDNQLLLLLYDPHPHPLQDSGGGDRILFDVNDGL